MSFQNGCRGLPPCSCTREEVPGMPGYPEMFRVKSYSLSLSLRGQYFWTDEAQMTFRDRKKIFFVQYLITTTVTIDYKSANRGQLKGIWEKYTGFEENMFIGTDTSQYWVNNWGYVCWIIRTLCFTAHLPTNVVEVGPESVVRAPWNVLVINISAFESLRLRFREFDLISISVPNNNWQRQWRGQRRISH